MLVFSLLLTACQFDENLPETTISGKLILPREAATWVDADGTETVDIRVVGPIYLGAFSGIDDVAFGYPHPSMGPIISGNAGDTFPYGGGTIGRVDFACYQFTSCKVTTGRFRDWDDLLDYFKNRLGSPLTDDYGNEVLDGATFKEYCYEYWDITSDFEVSFISESDDEDFENRLDFTENADGDFEAEWSMFHTTFVPGMSLWGYMDKPKPVLGRPDINGNLSTCDAESGRQAYEYDQSFYEGRVDQDLLNHPSDYLDQGDWITTPTTIDNAEDTVTITLDIPYPSESE